MSAGDARPDANSFVAAATGVRRALVARRDMPLVDAHDFLNPRGRPLRKLLGERVVRDACLRQVILDGLKNGAVRLSHDAPETVRRAMAWIAEDRQIADLTAGGYLRRLD